MSKAVRDSLISVGSVVLFVLAVGFTGFYYWQYQGLEEDLQALEQSKSNAVSQLEEFKSQRQIYPKIRAYQIFQTAESMRVQWSKVLQDILQYQNFNLRFDNFSSDSDKLITIQGWSRTLEGVSIFLEQLKKDPQISGPFISAVGQTTEGGTFGYSFDIAFYYQGNRGIMKNLSLLLILISGVLYGLVIRDYQGESARATARIQSLKNQIRELKGELAALEGQEEALGTQLELAYQRIPQDSDQENLIRDIQKISKESGFGFKAIGFGKGFNNQVRTPQLSISFSVAGAYSQLFSFLRLLEQNERFLGMNDISLSMEEDPDLGRQVRTSIALYALYQE